jgi:hypothetical protein
MLKHTLANCLIFGVQLTPDAYTFTTLDAPRALVGSSSLLQTRALGINDSDARSPKCSSPSAKTLGFMASTALATSLECSRTRSPQACMVSLEFLASGTNQANDSRNLLFVALVRAGDQE